MKMFNNIKKTLIWLNNNLLPISYRIWKEEQDKTCSKIKKDLRPLWMSSQYHGFLSVIPPMTIFLAMFGLSLLSLGFQIDILKSYLQKDGLIFILFGIILLFYFLVTYLFIRFYERYNNEKFIELSQK